MKRRVKNRISCLLVVTLLLFGTIPCQAIPSPIPPKQVASIEELLRWYGGLYGNALQECIVTEPATCKGDVVLRATTGRVDITFMGGLHIPAGARLTIDNPNLAMMGLPPAVTVEPGGVLHIRRWNALATQAMPQGGIVVQAGGTLLLDAGITLPKGVVIDNNPPPNTLPPPNTILPPPEPETPDPEIPPPPPDGALPPETPPAEEKLSITGEVLKVSAQSTLLAMVTLPRVDPELTETIVIERSADAKGWNTEYIFRWDEDALGFASEETSEFGRMVSKNRNDGSKTDFKYLARLSGAPFYLRVTVTKADGSKAVSDAIGLTEPPVGQYPGSEDYEDSGGNRGGGGQGSTDREEQKETEAPNPESAFDDVQQAPPQTPPQAASTASPPVTATALQEPVATPQSTVQQGAPSTEEAALPTQANLPEQNKPLGSSDRNWLVITATLVLCGTIWIFTIKRKKS